MKADGNISSQLEGNRPDFLTKWKLVEMALRDSRLGHSRIPTAILQCLIEHDGPSGCFVGRARLAELCDVDRSRITTALNRLEEQRYIRWDQRWNDKKRQWQSNRYRINYGKVSDTKEPNPLPECEEESAMEEVAEYVQKVFKCDFSTASSIADSLCDQLYEESSSETVGRHLFKLLRDAQKNPSSGSELDYLIEGRLRDLKNQDQ